MMDRTVVVVSAFCPDDELRQNILHLLTAAFPVIVVDDGSGPGYDAVFGRLVSSGATVHRLGDNSGIAHALNVGITAALKDGADYVLTLDQDSAASPELVEKLVSAHQRASASGKPISFVVPEFFAGVRQVHREHSNGKLETRNVIQSGMLVPKTTFSHVGLLKEDLFIDLVDTEFGLRCSCAGMEGIAARGAALDHRLGKAYCRPGLLRHLPFMPSEMTLSSPFRYYYRARNRIVVNAQYGFRRPGWILRDSIIDFLHFADTVSVALPKRALLAIFSEAIMDGVRGRMGRIPEKALTNAAAVKWTASELVPL